VGGEKLLASCAALSPAASAADEHSESAALSEFIRTARAFEGLGVLVLMISPFGLI
jgi:hypothetical protein